MSEPFRVSDEALRSLLANWDGLWSVWRGGLAGDPIFKRLKDVSSEGLPPVTSNPDERARRQGIFSHHIREVGIIISVAAQERGYQIDALDKLIEDPLMADFKLHKPVGVLMDKLRVHCAPRFDKAETSKGAVGDATPPKAKKTKTAKDGPRPPDQFFYQSKSTTLQPKPWMLLNYLWKNPSRTCKITDAEHVVWGEEPESDGRLKSAITRINSALSGIGCPLLVRKKSQFISLR